MLNRFARAFFTRLFTPIAKALLRLRVSPDAVTVVGTLGVCIGALVFYPQGEFLVGTLVITAFVFSDNVDGIMARLSDRQGSWGAFLDSVLNRFGDAANFLGLGLHRQRRHRGACGPSGRRTGHHRTGRLVRPAARGARGRALDARGRERLDRVREDPHSPPTGHGGVGMSASITERFTLLGYTAGWSAVRHLPDRVAYATFRTIADRVWRRRGPRVRGA